MASWYDEDDEDFEEEVVWDVVRERRDVSPKAKKAKDLSTATSSYSSSSSSSTKRFPTSARMIPRKATSSSSSSSSTGAARQSAPVNIPDWSKIYQLNKNHPSAHDDDDESYSMGGYNNGGLVEEEDDGSEGDLEEEGKVPPHEWLAKKMARTRISSFSVCEGAGRTLKGRDLSKVRNAVLTRTGFLE
ncbi:uncharacterized protein LOC109712488 [Ananas comosus]|uniref:Uncharacterized protein LOC109712488 n=1 Tax=Ananas comosus TaxID=4615 RepID=A0A6P5FE40_ANACO|nr:uncharacterized protein LOC109712488 [Ananas comosus]